MALPDTPQTREEAYLNAVATGSTSGLPSAPQTREEQYLDYIAKNGGGGSGGGGVLVVTATLTDQTHGTCDKTMGEIWTAAQTMPVVLVQVGEGYGVITAGCVSVSIDSGGYKISGTAYAAATLDAYPSFSDDDGGDDTPDLH